MRVTLLSRAFVRSPYQRKAELIAADESVELTVAAPPKWRDETWTQHLERAHTTGYRLVETPIVFPGSFHLHFYPRFGQVLDAAPPHFAHIDEEPYNLATYLALRSSARRGARCIFFTWQNLNRHYPPPFSWFERYAYSTSSGAIAGSAGAEQVLRQKGFKLPVWVIPQFGVDPEVYSPPAAARTGVPLAVGYVGRVVPSKGVDLLVEALAGLDRQWRLEVVGDGPSRPEIEELARNSGVGAQVTFRSWLAGSDLPGFYRSLDVLVLPSRSTPSWIEQFGRVLIEAMACEVACIGSSCGEIPQVLGDAGLVFPEGDAQALAAHLRRLASDGDLRQELGRAGRQRVLERFTMARIAADTVQVYHQVAGDAAG